MQPATLSRRATDIICLPPPTTRFIDIFISIFTTFVAAHSVPTMAPKRPAKRRGDDEDGRPAKKGGKKGKQEPTYDTYDECLDGK